MRTAAVLVLLVACVHLILGKTITPEYKGCYSTRFVNQYAFYYKFNQSMNIEQGFAACNNRLTTYMGLQVEDSLTVNNFVYCGNDLTEVSPELDNSECSKCQENVTLSCGGTNSMAVYMLRESTPLAVLLKTGRGVELLVRNITTVKVSSKDSSSYQLVDYIYTEGLILFAVSTNTMRSRYDITQMQFTIPNTIIELSIWSYSFAVDFITHDIFIDGNNDDLVRTDTQGSPASVVSRLGLVPRQTTIDPFNRSLTFTLRPFDNINIWLLDDRRLITHTLNHLNIETVIALSMDIQERCLYAIVQLMEDSSSHLVRLDYGISRTILLFSGPQLVDATVLDVFRDQAVWVTTYRRVSVLYTCKLTPKCILDSLTSYSNNQAIYDFTIYHPEKQTPGMKRLCANMTCSHGCHLFSPFTARCTCPPGMELGPDNLSCNKGPTTTTTYSTSTSYDETSFRVMSDLTTEAISQSAYGTETSKNNNTSSSVIAFYRYIITICIIVNVVLLIGIGLLVIKLYKKVDYSPQTLALL